MRILFATYSEKTHFHAMVPLAWALRTAGHEVRVASQPALTEVITRTGLTAVPVGADHNLWRSSGRFLTKRFAETDPAAYKRIRGVEMPPFDVADRPLEAQSWSYLKDGYDRVVPRWYKMINDPMVEDMVEFARVWQPDLVVWEPASYAGPLAARAAGAAHARLLWSLDIFGMARQHFLALQTRQPAADRGDALAKWLGGHAAKLGFDFTEDLATGHFTIDQFPASLRMDGDLHHVGMRYVPYNGDAVVPRWLWDRPERRRVCLTLGTCATERFGGYPVSVREILDSLADVDVDVVATISEEEQAALGPVPDNTRLVTFVPLHALVPTCVAVIHHGGFGTANTVALNAVPQLVLPEQHDAPPLAQRIADRGAGLAEYYSDVTGDKVRAHLVRLLEEPSFVRQAQLLQAEMLAMPTPNALVGEIERLTATYRPS